MFSAVTDQESPLRSSTSLASQYASLKAELARKHRADREAYTDAKCAFVDLVLSARS